MLHHITCRWNMLSSFFVFQCLSSYKTHLENQCNNKFQQAFLTLLNDSILLAMISWHHLPNSSNKCVIFAASFVLLYFSKCSLEISQTHQIIFHLFENCWMLMNLNRCWWCLAIKRDFFSTLNEGMFFKVKISRGKILIWHSSLKAKTTMIFSLLWICIYNFR